LLPALRKFGHKARLLKILDKAEAEEWEIFSQIAKKGFNLYGVFWLFSLPLLGNCGTGKIAHFVIGLIV
jgi:hypothetical protein